MSWLVLPAYHHGASTASGIWMDVGAYVFALGAAGLAVLFLSKGHSWVPGRDPRLHECLHGDHAEVHEEGDAPSGEASTA